MHCLFGSVSGFQQCTKHFSWVDAFGTKISSENHHRRGLSQCSYFTLATSPRPIGVLFFPAKSVVSSATTRPGLQLLRHLVPIPTRPGWALNMPNIIRFINGPTCLQGRLEETGLCVDVNSGLIVDGALEITSIHDVQDHIIAPAFLELQTNGSAGFHFIHFENAESYRQNLVKVSRYLVSTGVGSYWATIPTVSSDVFTQVSLRGQIQAIHTALKRTRLDKLTSFPLRSPKSKRQIQCEERSRTR